MKRENIINLIKKLKRTQRRDAMTSDLIKDKLFNVTQMCDSFDLYLDWLIEEVKKKEK